MSAVTTETIAELVGLPQDEIKRLTHQSLVHDKDKRNQIETKTRQQIMEEELEKTGSGQATSPNLRGSEEWTLGQYILRYVDSSIGDKEGTAHILPWRDRVAGFKTGKADENDLGKPIFGVGTWEKLQEVMEKIEPILYQQIISLHPELAGTYPQPESLTQLIEDRIHEKILSFDSSKPEAK